MTARARTTAGFPAIWTKLVASRKARVLALFCARMPGKVGAGFARGVRSTRHDAGIDDWAGRPYRIHEGMHGSEAGQPVVATAVNF